MLEAYIRHKCINFFILLSEVQLCAKAVLQTSRLKLCLLPSSQQFVCWPCNSLHTQWNQTSSPYWRCAYLKKKNLYLANKYQAVAMVLLCSAFRNLVFCCKSWRDINGFLQRKTQKLPKGKCSCSIWADWSELVVILKWLQTEDMLGTNVQQGSSVTQHHLLLCVIVCDLICLGKEKSWNEVMHCVGGLAFYSVR